MAHPTPIVILDAVVASPGPDDPTDDRLAWLHHNALVAMEHLEHVRAHMQDGVWSTEHLHVADCTHFWDFLHVFFVAMLFFVFAAVYGSFRGPEAVTAKEDGVVKV